MLVEESAFLFRKMPEDICPLRPLFGGAIASTFPVRFQVSSYISIMHKVQNTIPITVMFFSYECHQQKYVVTIIMI